MIASVERHEGRRQSMCRSTRRSDRRAALFVRRGAELPRHFDQPFAAPLETFGKTPRTGPTRPPTPAAPGAQDIIAEPGFGGELPHGEGRLTQRALDLIL
jgi:hypothetical protein